MSPSFSFQGSGVRAADDFFYKPYLVARENTTVDMTSLGYWSLPFTLEEHPLDNHWMITYSVPLLCNGEIYGIVGAEVSTSYLSNNYLSLRELDRSQNAGYALAIDQGDGSYGPSSARARCMKPFIRRTVCLPCGKQRSVICSVSRTLRWATRTFTPLSPA